MFIKETSVQKFLPLEGNDKEFILNSNIIKHLVIDNCRMSDSNFAKILQALIDQRELIELRYNNNSIGPKSIKYLKLMLDNEMNGNFL